MSSASELIDSYCLVWSDPDQATRAERLVPIWQTDGSYTDPTVHLTGRDELLAHIAQVQRTSPGMAVVRTGSVDSHHGIARFTWRATSADGAVLREGVDIAFFSPDGMALARVIGFFQSR